MKGHGQSLVRVGPLALAGLLALPLGAAAQSCRVDVTPLAFGVYDPARAAPTDTRTEIALVCGGDAHGRSPASVAIRIAGDTARTLAGTGAVLRYQLFHDAASTRAWHGNDAATVALAAAADGRPGETRVPIYGRLPPGQWAPAGAYADSVEIVVEF